MAFGKYIGLKGLTYRGGDSMLAWLLHRISGVGMVIFIGLHILASFGMQQLSGEVGTAINIVYESPWFQLFIFFCVLFHALNGLRISLLDLWPRYWDAYTYRWAMRLQWIIFIVLYGFAAFFLISSALTSG